MSDRAKRNALAALGFAFCLLAVSLAVGRTWQDIQPPPAVSE